jgi:hypothetical protein
VHVTGLFSLNLDFGGRVLFSVDGRRLAIMLFFGTV